MGDFKVKFSCEPAPFQVQFDSGTPLIVNFGEVQTVSVGGELYKGDYTVTPKVDPQMLRTKGKLLTDNVTVKSIPIFEVSNTSGGATVYIGSEV